MHSIEKVRIMITNTRQVSVPCAQTLAKNDEIATEFIEEHIREAVFACGGYADYYDVDAYVRSLSANGNVATVVLENVPEYVSDEDLEEASMRGLEDAA